MDFFIPGWKEFCRKEEGVQAYYFTGSDEDAQELMAAFPDNFVIRTTEDKQGNRISKLCMQDSTTEICILKPNTWIVRDSCGRFYTYDKQFFELAFIEPENKQDDIETFAKELYKAEQTKANSAITGDLPNKWEALDEKEQAKRVLAVANFLRNFVIFRR